MLRYSVLFIASAALVLPARAEPCVPEGTTAVRVFAVGADGFILEDGRRVELAGVEILSLDGFESYQGEARLGEPSGLSRHGRLRADLWIEGASLSERLVGRGAARVRPRPSDKTCFSRLLRAEEKARREKLGLWSKTDYAVLDAAKPDDVARHADRFALVQGKVLHVGETKGWLWIDFGPVWRTDVTVAIPQRERPRFLAAGLTPKSLEGQVIRVRGVVTLRDGPRLEITEPAAIERVSDNE